MRHWAIALKIAVGLTSLTLVVVFLAQMVGVLPDPFLAERLRRTAICESLAIHCSLAAQRGDHEGLREIARAVVERNPDLVFLSVEQVDGPALLVEGDAALADAPQPGMMQATVPISMSDRPWGQVRVVFHAPELAGWGALTGDPSLRLAIFVGAVGSLLFFGYGLLLVRRLVPTGSSLIPERVRETLDTFAEGVLVMDKDQRIAYANQAFCTLAGESGELLRGTSASQLPWVDIEPDLGERPWEKAIDQRESQRGTLGLRGSAPMPHTLAVQATPIQEEGELYGTLATFDDLTTVEKMNLRLRRLLKMLRRSRAEIRQQNRELHRLATVDPLTQCFNRREFFSRLVSLFSTARRHELPLSCVMVDVDYFKSVNDIFGHATGDKVLVQVAAALRAASRDSDIVCRFGGEEFCIVLPQTNLEQAREAAERFRQAIADLELGELTVTASLGVSSVSLGAESTNQLIEQADQALYAAKHAGRNRVVLFSENAAAAPTATAAQ